MEEPVFKKVEFTENRFFGSFKDGPVISIPGELTQNDDGTLNYKLNGYGIICPDGWPVAEEDFAAGYRDRSRLPGWILKIFERSKK